MDANISHSSGLQLTLTTNLTMWPNTKVFKDLLAVTIDELRIVKLWTVILDTIQYKQARCGSNVNNITNVISHDSVM